MFVTCHKCNQNYDDEIRWTICPHNSLQMPHDAIYCRRCDIYVGYTNIMTISQTPNNCIVCGRSKEEIINVSN